MPRSDVIHPLAVATQSVGYPDRWAPSLAVSNSYEAPSGGHPFRKILRRARGRAQVANTRNMPPYITKGLGGVYMRLFRYPESISDFV